MFPFKGTIPYQDYAVMNYVETNALIKAASCYKSPIIMGDLNRSPEHTDANNDQLGVLSGKHLIPTCIHYPLFHDIILTCFETSKCTSLYQTGRFVSSKYISLLL